MLMSTLSFDHEYPVFYPHFRIVINYDLGCCSWKSVQACPCRLQRKTVSSELRVVPWTALVVATASSGSVSVMQAISDLLVNTVSQLPLNYTPSCSHSLVIFS